ncbi:MAG: redoxin domain-containing protein [Myxococcota bacterium]
MSPSADEPPPNGDESTETDSETLEPEAGDDEPSSNASDSRTADPDSEASKPDSDDDESSSEASEQETIDPDSEPSKPDSNDDASAPEKTEASSSPDAESPSADTTDRAPSSSTTPPEPASTPSRTPGRFELRVGAGLGLGMRRPAWTEGPVSLDVRPGLAAELWATPWIERRWRRDVAFAMPMTYASTISARVVERGPGFERTRPIRSQVLDLALDAMTRVGPDTPVRVWIGGGVMGRFSALGGGSSGVGRNRGVGSAGVRAPLVLHLGDDRAVVGIAPGLALVVPDPYARQVGLDTLGVAVSLDARAHLRLGRGVWATLRYTERGAWWSAAVDDSLRVLTVGLSIRGPRARGPEEARRRPPRAAAPPPPEPTQQEPEKLAPAPPLEGVTLDGTALNLAELRGKVVVVDFWASWCGPCREAMPRLQELHERLGAQGLVVLGVSMDEEQSDAREFVESHGVGFPIIVDTEQRHADSWQPAKMPTTFIVGPQGNIVATHAGYTPEEGDAIAAEVERLLKTTPSTSALDNSR